jgi:multicomponent K+:H+ antiporter subunit G
MNDLPVWLDILLSFLVMVGAVFSLIGSLGLVKLSTFLLRVHGPTKSTTLGVGCVLVSSAVWFSATGDQLTLRELLVVVFLFITAPVSAQLLTQAAARLDAGLRPPVDRGVSPKRRGPTAGPNFRSPF